MGQRVADRENTASQPPSGLLVSTRRGVATALAGLVLLQAVVAGQSLFGRWQIEVHGWMGNASFLLGVLLMLLAVRARAGRTAVVLALGLVVALFTQTGLGYAGRTTAGAAAWHVPLGVAIFGLSVVNATLAWAPALAPTPARPR